MTSNRSYGDGCAIATALDLVGERWALLIVRELLLGPKRFSDLQTELPGVGPKVLAQRLRELEADDVVRRATLPPPAASRVYELTERGAELDPVVVALGRWGAGTPAPSADPVSADSAVLRLRALFRPQPDQPWDATYELRLGRYRYTARITAGRLAGVSRQAPRDRPDTVIESDPDTFARALDSEPLLTGAVNTGALTVTGDDRSGHRLFAATRR